MERIRIQRSVFMRSPLSTHSCDVYSQIRNLKSLTALCYEAHYRSLLLSLVLSLDSCV